MKNSVNKQSIFTSRFMTLAILAIGVIMTSCGGDENPTPQAEDITFDYVTYEQDAVVSTETHNYYDDGSSNLSLTLYNVDNSTDNAKPLVILAPGGGFHSYNRVDEIKVLAQNLAHRGYASAVVLYTIDQPDPDTWFSAFLDIKTAIKFFKKNADQFEIDPERIFSGGWSTGAQLAMKAAHLDMEDYNNFDQSIIHDFLDEYVADGIEPSIYPEYSSSVKGSIILLPTSWDEDYFDSDGPALFMVGNERSTFSSGESLWGTVTLNGITHAGGDVLFDKAESHGYVDGDDLELHLAPTSLDAQYSHVNHTVLDNMFYDQIAGFIQRNLD